MVDRYPLSNEYLDLIPGKASPPVNGHVVLTILENDVTDVCEHVGIELAKCYVICSLAFAKSLWFTRLGDCQ